VHASWLIALALGLLMLSLAAASASAHTGYTLTDPQVTPRETTFGTAIDFSVTFTDDTGAAPKSVQVQVEDSVSALAPASQDYRRGVSFSASVEVSVGWHAVSFIATPAVGSRVVVQSGSVTVHHPTPTPTRTPTPTPTPSPTRATASPSPKPTASPTASPIATPQPAESGSGSGAPGATASGTAAPTQLPAGGAAGSATPKPSAHSGSAATPTHPAATPSPSPTVGSAGAIGSEGPGAGTEQAAGDPENGGGQKVDGADGSLGASASGHGPGPGLVQVARGGSGKGNSGDVPSYLLVSYHAPLSQLIVDLAPSISTAAGGTAAWAAFVLFGKRRRDGAGADPEAALAAAAATGLEVAAGQGLTTVDESLMPRWRRPSLQRVRRTDPLRAVVEASSLSFAASGLQTDDGYERRQIRYRLVRLLDCPDELRSSEIGVLDRGDEVLLLERRGVYWRVLCPDGREGWVHRMTLSEPAVEQPREAVPWEDPALAAYTPADAEPSDPTFEVAASPESEPADPGYLEAYMQARSEALRAAETLAAASVPAAEPSTEPAPAGEPGCAGERCSGRKNAGTRKAATGSRPGTKSRRPSR
jgi:hypothetical protein